MAHCCFQVSLQCLVSALTPGGESGLFFGLTSSFEQRRQWHPTPVLLPGNSHGRRSLVGCSPWGRYESEMTERLHFHFSLSCIGEGNGNPLQCSCLENPRDRGAWWTAVYGVAQSRTQLRPLSSSSSSSRPLFLLCYVLLCFPLFTWQISYCVFHYLSRNQASFDFIII